MNPKPIETACDSDLRLSGQAMQRAAQRARELAARTGTELIVSRNGVIERIRPLPGDVGHELREPSAPYGNAS
ncbi:MAG: hypothetical protein KDE68_00180 [Rhodocyclaceae bacterium]|nr:hypothetical protein [Rhodocyclaceae bacterium]